MVRLESDIDYYVHINGCMGVSVGVSVRVAVGVSVGVAVGVAVSVGVPKALLWGFTSGCLLYTSPSPRD